jgi:mannose-6-phosphate isomerase-like protein (cupin superfamily)
MKPTSKYKPLKHYIWGNDCDGWTLVDEEGLSVKQEQMPGGASELKHYHRYAQQYFYVLKGEAQFEVEDDLIDVCTGEGILIEAGKKHRIINNTSEALEFILCSQPSTNNDRIIL